MSPAVQLAVLVVVLLVGAAAGRGERRWSLLLAGLLTVLVLGMVAAALLGRSTRPQGPDDPAAEVALLYTTVVPLLVAFAAGWLCGRGTWLRRLIVLGVAALLLAGFPYAAAARATADLLAEPVTGAVGQG